MDSLTWDDIVNFVSEIHTREGGQPSRVLYRTLANQCLRELAESTPIRRKVWPNDGADGSPVLTSNLVTLPVDLVTVEAVEWDSYSYLLVRTTIEQLDEMDFGWRTRTGDPTRFAQFHTTSLILDAAPTGTTTDKLVVRGTAYLPAFSDTPTDQNPLDYIPAGQQLIVAYYIMANLPVAGVVPINESPSAATLAQFQTQKRFETKEQYAAKYEQMRLSLAIVDNQRKRDILSY